MHNDVCTFKLCLKSRRETEKVEKQGDFLACTVQTSLISGKLPKATVMNYNRTVPDIRSITITALS